MTTRPLYQIHQKTIHIHLSITPKTHQRSPIAGSPSRRPPLYSHLSSRFLALDNREDLVCGDRHLSEDGQLRD